MKAHQTKVEYADHRFQQIGVERQMNSNNYWDAKSNYLRSCELCCTRGYCGAVKCVSCPIRDAFLTNAAIFYKKIPIQEQNWVQKEKALA